MRCGSSRAPPQPKYARRRASIPGLRLPPLGAQGLTIEDQGGVPRGGGSTPSACAHSGRGIRGLTQSLAPHNESLLIFNDDILVSIVQYLGPRSFLRLGTTSRRFHKLTQDAQIWFKLYCHRWGSHVTAPCAEETWISRYRARAQLYSAERAMRDPEFRRRMLAKLHGGDPSHSDPLDPALLRRAKYASWAINTSVSCHALPALLYAIGELGASSLHGGHLSHRQAVALHFMHEVFNVCTRQQQLNKDSEDWLNHLAGLLNPVAHSNHDKRPALELDFEQRTAWARQGLSCSDIFGVLWHVGGFAVRGWESEMWMPGVAHSRSLTPDEEPPTGALSLSLPASRRQAQLPSCRDDFVALHKLEQRQLMCILHLAKLGSGQATYYQLGGRRHAMPEALCAVLHAEAVDRACSDIEAEVETLRRTVSPSQLTVAAPRPSSGGITDSFGRPFAGLWGEDECDEQTREPDNQAREDPSAQRPASQTHRREDPPYEVAESIVVGCHRSPRSSTDRRLLRGSSDCETAESQAARDESSMDLGELSLDDRSGQ